MLYGIGCDLCQIDRIEKLLAGPHGPAFVRRVFGPDRGIRYPAVSMK